MTGRLILLLGIASFVLGYIFYGKYLTRIFRIDADRPTPANTRQDGVDFVPAKAPVLFGHHFASIAGAGPIVGPVLGICFGWIPVLLWILIGCVFIGAVHDFSALVVSIRNNGQTIGHIIERYISYTGKQIFLIFCCAALLLIVAIFTLFIAKTFVSTPSVATSSIIFIVLAIVFGIINRCERLSLSAASMIFIPLLFFGIYLGLIYPINLMTLGFSVSQVQMIWIILLLFYAFVASVVPVWALLQPRDYLNSFLLYAMIILGFLSIITVNPSIQIPHFEGFSVVDPLTGLSRWSLFPILFVTVACGACSGFHSLVSSGTTSKQISNEKHALPIGYGAMLVEGLLALITLIAVAIMPKQQYLSILQTQGPVNTFSMGLAGLSQQLGLPLSMGKTFISLTVSAFMLTTLDTATRLTRFTIHELAMPKVGGNHENPTKLRQIFLNRFWATGLIIFIAGYLAFSGDGGRIWPVFGASNQLLAALTLLVLTVVFIREKRPAWTVFIPFVFMASIAGWALLKLFVQNLLLKQWLLCFCAGLLLLQAIAIAVHTTLKMLWK